MAGNRAAVTAVLDLILKNAQDIRATFEAEYPAVVVPTTGTTVDVLPGQSLQTALDQAPLNPTLLLTPDAYYGDVDLRKRADNKIIIRSKTEPPTGWNTQRTTAKPKVRYLTALAGAHDYALIGLGADVLDKTDPEWRDHAFWMIGWPDTPNIADLPQRIQIDRCHLRADPAKGSHHGIGLYCGDVAVLNSVLEGMWQENRDCNCVGGYWGPGPFRIEGNYLEGGGENVIFGGRGAPVPDGFHPSNLTLRKNYIFKRPEWRPVWKITDPTRLNPDGTVFYNYDNLDNITWISGKHYCSKNLLELKEMRGALIEFNVFENSWSDAQNGDAIVLTTREGVINNIKFRYNVIKNAESGIRFLGQNDGSEGYPSVGKSNDCNIYSNLFRNVQAGFLINKGWDNLRLQKNTLTGLTRHLIALTGKIGDPKDLLTNFKFLNNIANAGAYWLHGDGTQGYTTALAPFLDANRQIAGNVIGNPLGGVSNDFFPDPTNKLVADAESLIMANGAYTDAVGAEIAKMLPELFNPVAVFA